MTAPISWGTVVGPLDRHGPSKSIAGGLIYEAWKESVLSFCSGLLTEAVSRHIPSVGGGGGRGKGWEGCLLTGRNEAKRSKDREERQEGE